MRYLPFIGPVIFILLWASLSQFQVIDQFFFPSPFATLKTLGELLSTSLIPDLLATVDRVVVAFAIATIVGLPTGLWLGRSEPLYRSVEFVIDFFRSVPPVALFPLFLLIFGVTDSSKIAVSAFAAVLIIIFNTAYGVIFAKRSRLLAARLMGANERQIFSTILFWESLPQTFIGLRSAATLSLVMIIVTEMLVGTTVGLGRKIIDAQITYEIPSMYAVILLTGIVGYLLNLLFLKTEKKLLHWSGK